MARELFPEDADWVNLPLPEGQGEEEPSKERKRRLWQVTFDKEGNVLGLPEGVTQKDVILFLGGDGQWYAENPSPEILEEIRMWRSDWQ